MTNRKAKVCGGTGIWGELEAIDAGAIQFAKRERIFARVEASSI
ncbi:hypothetical protein GGD40_004679 [Paraburkholderia bryophila]|uniref:Uncharacterized protein n=1 Tax=Paraburkholderia bryophila TaxID=420952 RepID=A0A7Y9WR99_9BURK|nr:hypothetical protein [Paraburkholderia bryophila]